ncbi:MAG: hypothetical protein NTZ05_10645, partial [Chloroflexi bacterium]|nr:hypothetical protein [Chloroflexota bacterium]
MGGIGSGRHAVRTPAEGRLQIDVRALHRQKAFDKPSAGLYHHGVLRYSRDGKDIGGVGWAVRHREDGDAAILEVRHAVGRPGGTHVPVAISVPVEWAPCRLGGARPWLLCPRCGRRCAVLYSLEMLFACRTCGRVCYRSQQNSAYKRARARRDRLRDRLEVRGSEWPAALPWKQRWMRWTT